MSLLTIVATSKFVSFMSDGRLTNKCGSSIREDYKKIMKLTEKIIIGAAGNHKQAEKLFNKSRNLLTEENGNIEIFVGFLREMVLIDIPRSKYPSINLQVAVGGLTENNEIVKFCFNNSEDYKLRKKLLNSNGEISYLVLGSPYATNRLRNLINKEKNKSIAKIITKQKEVNSYIAQLDNTVNNVTFNEVIELTD